jgi:pilus assembly protein Flp/PilA
MYAGVGGGGREVNPYPWQYPFCVFLKFESSLKTDFNKLLLCTTVSSFPRRCIMQKLLAHFAKDASAATAIEYGLIAAGIALAIILAVNGLGTTLNGTFGNINTQLR